MMAVASIMAVILAHISATSAQFTAPPACDVYSVIESLNTACCTPTTCRGSAPSQCSPACSIEMATMKGGPCASTMRAVIDMTEGLAPDGISETLVSLWRACTALPAQTIQAAISSSCSGTSSGNEHNSGPVGGHRILVATTNSSHDSETVSAEATLVSTHRRVQTMNSRQESARRASNEQLLLNGIRCDAPPPPPPPRPCQNEAWESYTSMDCTAFSTGFNHDQCAIAAGLPSGAGSTQTTAAPPQFRVNSGPCVTTMGGQCVGRPTGYDHHESCTITSLAPSTISPCPIFHVETAVKDPQIRRTNTLHHFFSDHLMTDFRTFVMNLLVLLVGLRGDCWREGALLFVADLQHVMYCLCDS